MPVKPRIVNHGPNVMTTYRCGSCDTPVYNIHIHALRRGVASRFLSFKNDRFKFCPDCGAKIDWSPIDKENQRNKID